MFRKISSTTLVVILVILVAIVALNKFYLSKKTDSTFSDVFVKIDTSKLTQVLIYPKAEYGKEIKLTRAGKGWEVQNAQQKVEAGDAPVNHLLLTFANVKSLALAGNDKSSWKQYQVDDSSGTHVKFVTSDNQVYDFVVGKYAINTAARSIFSYIRRKNEDQVYAVEGVLSITVEKPFNYWRNSTFINGDKNNWDKLTFTYPADSSFVLLKQNGGWTVNGNPADSSRVAQYLTMLSHMANNSFTAPYTPSAAPLYSLSIEGKNQAAPIKVAVYTADAPQRYILHSSLNTATWFNDGNLLAEKIFVGPKTFLAK